MKDRPKVLLHVHVVTDRWPEMGLQWLAGCGAATNACKYIRLLEDVSVWFTCVVAAWVKPPMLVPNIQSSPGLWTWWWLCTNEVSQSSWPFLTFSWHSIYYICCLHYTQVFLSQHMWITRRMWPITQFHVWPSNLWPSIFHQKYLSLFIPVYETCIHATSFLSPVHLIDLFWLTVTMKINQIFEISKINDDYN